MAKRIQPWHKALPPRDDLREGRPQDAAEFAVQLDDVRTGGAPSAYSVPQEFFSRTYMTHSLTDLGAQVVRRLSGNTVGTSAIFNLATQFGGGKTHALTMLYHLAQEGSSADAWPGVAKILRQAEVASVPDAATAVFVGNEFDPIAGRHGPNEPLRRTPWGEIAWQVGGLRAFSEVEEHDRRGIEPKGDVIRAFLPKDRPCLILMDEVLNYLSTYRQLGEGDQFYRFLHSLTETARSLTNVCLVVSIPASELEYSSSDQADEARLKKLLDRVGKALMMSADVETAEIVRRRLFDWQGLPDAAYSTADAYVGWLSRHRQLTSAGELSTERDRFLTAYPFHPALLSVFERKWQSLPRFQRTRGILRMLALWVSTVYELAYRENRGDLLIGLGTAPLEEPYFRAAVFEQLGTSELEAGVTADIAGSVSSHAVVLDRESDAEMKQRELHRRTLTSIFFESNGGQTRTEATLAEIRYAVGDPTLDIASVETALEALSNTCFYLKSRQSGYWFSTKPNLNLVLVSARARVDDTVIKDRIKRETERMFRAGDSRVEREFFPRSGSDIPDRPRLVVGVLGIDRTYDEAETDEALRDIFAMASAPRIYKGGLILCVADDTSGLLDQMRQQLALEDTSDDAETIGSLEASDRQLLETQLRQAREDVTDSVWQTYRHVYVIGDSGSALHIDLGRGGSSKTEAKVDNILARLIREERVTEALGTGKLIRSWPIGVEFWTTEALRDAFYSSPRLPRLIDPLALRRAIAAGVTNGELGYASGTSAEAITNVMIAEALSEHDVEIRPDFGILKPEDARRLREPSRLTTIAVEPAAPMISTGESIAFSAEALDQHGRPMTGVDVSWSATGGGIDPTNGLFTPSSAGVWSVEATANGISESAIVHVRDPGAGRPGGGPENGGQQEPSASLISWRGSVPPQVLNHFYMRVLATLAGYDLQLNVEVSIKPPSGSAEVLADQMKSALAALGLDSDALKWTSD